MRHGTHYLMCFQYISTPGIAPTTRLLPSGQIAHYYSYLACLEDSGKWVDARIIGISGAPILAYLTYLTQATEFARISEVLDMFRKILSYGMTVPMLFSFALIYVGLHPLFILAHFFGKADSVMFLLNFLTNRSLIHLTGMKYRFVTRKDLPHGRPIIVVSNHQSMFDITLLYEAFRGFRLGFIAKIELGRGIPCVSWVLRNLGAALINRDDARQSVSEIRRFGRQVEEEQRAVLIFPEGTRARDGEMKKFLASGLLSLLKAVPSAVVVPVVIEGSWKIVQFRLWPIPYGTRVTLKILEPIEPSGHDLKQLPDIIETRIREELNSLRCPGPGEAVQSEGGKASSCLQCVR